MRTDVAVSAVKIGKKFPLYQSAGDRIREALHPFGRQYHEEFWALRDVSFELPQGHTIGILGRNGSGKSTLLQILCGIMRPTLGCVEIRGRVSALLELGAGFNPEFTGRDNAILNGAVMGFSRREMLDRLPEIEEFADIGEFFDQPVKLYSSGMYSRLAFACAIHVDPDVLVVDEALSVGDAKFQNKCFMHFRRFQASGRTILFVSHSTEAVLRNCDRALLLDHGKLINEGEPQRVVNHYFELLFPTGQSSSKTSARHAERKHEDASRGTPHLGRADDLQLPESEFCEGRNSYNYAEFRFGDRRVEIADYVLTADGKVDPVEIRSGASVSLFVRLRFNDFEGLLSAGFAVKTVDDVKVYGTNTIVSGVHLPVAKGGESLWVRFDFVMNVGAGDIFLDLGCGDWTSPPGLPLDRRHSVIHLNVTTDGKFDGIANLFSRVSVLGPSVV